jgi:hypothetical protein
MSALSGSIFRHDKSPTATGSVDEPSASRRLNNRYGQNAWAYARIWLARLQSARDVGRSIYNFLTILARDAWRRSSAAGDFSAGADTFAPALRTREDAARLHVRANIAGGGLMSAAVTPRTST